MVMGKLAQNLSTWEAQLTSEGWRREGGREREEGRRTEEGGRGAGGRKGGGERRGRETGLEEEETEEEGGGRKEGRKGGEGGGGRREEGKIKWPLSKQEPAGLGWARPSALSPPWTGPSSLQAHQPGAGPGGQGGS